MLAHGRAGSKMRCAYQVDHRAKVGGQRQVTTLVQGADVQSISLSLDAATGARTTQQPALMTMTVVAISVTPR